MNKWNFEALQVDFSRFFVQAAKFGIAGLVNTGVHFLVVVILVELAHLDPLISSIPAFCFAVITGFFLNRIWVFSATGSRLPQFVKFAVVTLSGFGINLFCMHIGTKILGFSYLPVLSVTVIIIATWSFLLNRFWTFR